MDRNQSSESAERRDEAQFSVELSEQELQFLVGGQCGGGKRRKKRRRDEEDEE